MIMRFLAGVADALSAAFWVFVFLAVLAALLGGLADYQPGRPVPGCDLGTLMRPCNH